MCSDGDTIYFIRTDPRTFDTELKCVVGKCRVVFASCKTLFVTCSYQIAVNQHGGACVMRVLCSVPDAEDDLQALAAHAINSGIDGSVR